MHRRLLLSSCLAILGALLLFFLMGARVWDGGTFSWDAPVLRSIHTFATPTWDAVMVFVTHRGRPGDVGILVVTLVISLVVWRRFKDAGFLVVAVGGVGLLDKLAKVTYQRERPRLWGTLTPELDYGFPSEHAMMSFALALAVVLLTWRTRWRWTAVTVGSGYALCMGLSRVYLGVHYPSDVLSGWLLAVAWVAAAAIIRRGSQLTPLMASPARQCAAYGLLILLPPAAYVGWVLSHDNFHIVSAGQVYRSGQMNSEALRRSIQDFRIRSIVNLRGANPRNAWYRNETNTAQQLEVKHWDFALSARREVSESEIEAILEAIVNAPKPVLIHCNGGADRSGLISSLFLYAAEGRPASQAVLQLNLFYGHVARLGWRDTLAMDRSFWRYVSNHVAGGATPRPSAP